MDKNIKDCIYMILENANNFKDLEEEIYQLVCLIVREKIKEILKEIDDVLKENRNKEIFKTEDMKERTIKTLVGPITIKRRYYIDPEGNYHFLLDEYLNLPSNDRQSPGLKEAAIKIVKDESYRDSAEKVEELLGVSISSSAIHNWVQKLGKKIKKESQKKSHKLFNYGLIPGQSEKKTSIEHLFVEADGIHIHLQNEEKNKGELKLGISYEGWEKRHPMSKEYKLSQKIYYGGVFESDRFWEQTTADMYEYFKFSKDSISVLNGDGASWISSGSEYLPGFAARFLDSFHYSRKILKKLGRSSYVPRVFKAIEAGDKESLIKDLQEAKNYRRKKKDKKKVEELKRYLLNHWEAIQNQHNKDLEIPVEIRGMGAIESNIDKVFANRFKKWGMRWSKEGAENLAQIILADRNNRLEKWFSCMNWEINQEKIQPKIKEAASKNKEGLTAGQKKTASYLKALKAHMPALEGPDSGKNWVKGLRKIATI